MTTLKKKFKNRASTAAPHIIVEALAGTGKTTTLVEGLKNLKGMKTSIIPSPQQREIWDALEQSKDARSIYFVAFNVSIAKELQRRVPKDCEASTMHSMGNKLVSHRFGRLRIPKNPDWVVRERIAEVVGRDLRKLMKEDYPLVAATQKLVSLCKQTLTGSDYDEEDGDWATKLYRLAGYYDVDLNGSASQVFDLVPRVLELCEDPNHDGMMDFDDMIWLPVVLGLPVVKHDLLLVDESQDLNRCQQELARKSGKRLILVGDTHQAIYGFAGADANSMERMRQVLTKEKNGCKVLPLTVTRRCGRAIVKEAQSIVPAFEAHETNPQGVIGRGLYMAPEGSKAETYHSQVEPGDMILCRVTAPLVSQCFKFLKEDRRAEILGRKIGQGLITTIEKMYADNVPHLVEKISDWLKMEIDKEERKRHSSEARMIALQDRHDCILHFCEGKNYVEEVIDHINDVFTDKPGVKSIRLSTIHKAKGLEADRVFLLEPKGATVPHPIAMKSQNEWQMGQEWNLRYVAITRAIEELIYVS